MDFSWTDEQCVCKQKVIEFAHQELNAELVERDKHGIFSRDNWQKCADFGIQGLAMPTEYGGAGLGVTEAALMMQTIAQTGAGFSGASAVHINLFGPHPIVVHGTDGDDVSALSGAPQTGVGGCCLLGRQVVLDTSRRDDRHAQVN